MFGNKKTWEKLSSLIPIVRPSHCLCTEISNSASPRHCVLYNSIQQWSTVQTALVVIWDIIHPAWTLRCGTFMCFCQVCEVWRFEDNVWKRPFMLLATARCTTSIMAAEAYSNKVFWPARPAGPALSKTKLGIIFGIEEQLYQNCFPTLLNLFFLLTEKVFC